MRLLRTRQPRKTRKATQARKARQSRKATDPLLLQTFWTGKPLSRMERAALQSYVNNGYTVDIYTYNPVAEFKQQIPETARHAVRVHDARIVLPEDQLFEYDGRAHIGKRNDAYKFLPFSDLFRFTMLHRFGGAWVDMDVFLIRPIPKSILRQPYVFSSERTIQKGAYKKAEPEIVDIGFIKVPGPKSPLMSWVLDRVPKESLLKSPFDFMTLYRKAIVALGLERYILPARAFLPLNWWDVKESFAEGSGAPNVCYPGKYGVAPFCVADLNGRDVYGVHWHRSLLRKKGLPYERAEDREVTNNLYESMIRDIEDAASAGRNSL
jgi:Capsular polysaccharide synthesis protein